MEEKLVSARITVSENGLADRATKTAELAWRQVLKEQMAIYRPRTPLGRLLLELRAKAIAAGEPLLDWDGIEREVRERRGEAYRTDA
jgi:hypothetical protein